jgi:fucose permease
VGGVCGGAVVPPILGHVADMRNDTGFAMIVPTMVCCECFCNSLLNGCIANDGNSLW